jgi:hypothetical protein
MVENKVLNLQPDGGKYSSGPSARWWKIKLWTFSTLVENKALDLHAGGK